MKTVMKKMFCLMLVAVLLVGAMPVAFAVADTYTCTEHNRAATYDASQSQASTCSATGWTTYVCKGFEDVPGDDHPICLPVDTIDHAFDAGVVTTAPTCTTDGVKTFTCTVCGATDTDPVNKLGHSFSNGGCAICGICENCQQTTCKCCPVCGNATGHTDTCSTLYCDKNCGRKIHDGYCCTNCNEYYHQVTACDKLYETCCNVAKGSAHRSDCVTNCTEKRDCKNANHKTGCQYALCDTNGCQLNEGHTGEHTGVPCSDTNCIKYLNHSGKHSYLCPTEGCDKPVNHAGNCGLSGYDIPTGSYSLKVWARIWVHETKDRIIELDTITGLSGDAKIYQVIAANKTRLNSKLPSGYQNLHWDSGISYMTNKTTYADVGTSTTVADEKEVYVNLYASEQLLVVNVHTSKSWGYDLSVRLEGFSKGDVVSYEDVLKAVKKYYNVSSMSIYTYEEMCKMLEGKTASKTTAFKAGDREDPYEVFISGSRKGGTTTYKADSTNPKTGDEIFAPVMIMGLSVSALAVLYYLNKKRAY